MIELIITIGLALIWLGYETNWMTIRLPYGADIPPAIYTTWDMLKPYRPDKQYPFWVRCPDAMSPLCGWDYINNARHIVPQYKIEIAAFGVRNKITLKDGGNAKLLKDISTAALKATKAQKLAYAIL